MQRIFFMSSLAKQSTLFRLLFKIDRVTCRRRAVSGTLDSFSSNAGLLCRFLKAVKIALKKPSLPLWDRRVYDNNCERRESEPDRLD